MVFLCKLTSIHQSSQRGEEGNGCCLAIGNDSLQARGSSELGSLCRDIMNLGRLFSRSDRVPSYQRHLERLSRLRKSKRSAATSLTKHNWRPPWGIELLYSRSPSSFSAIHKVPDEEPSGAFGARSDVTERIAAHVVTTCGSRAT